jgi:hypothetical protein
MLFYKHLPKVPEKRMAIKTGSATRHQSIRHANASPTAPLPHIQAMEFPSVEITRSVDFHFGWLSTACSREELRFCARCSNLVTVRGVWLALTQ